MIIDNRLNIKTNPSNYKHYLDLGYSIHKCGDIIDIDVQHLPKTSHVDINVKCQKCNIIKTIKYNNYVRQIKDSYYCCSKCQKYKLEEHLVKTYGVTNAQFIDGVKEKIENTCILNYGVKSVLELTVVRNRIKEIYGVDNISQLQSIKELKKEKSLIKFNTDSPLQYQPIIDEIRRKHILSGFWSEYDKVSFKRYSSRVKYRTDKIKYELFNSWDGFDYYDGENIINNLLLDFNDRLYPTIDHKTPTLFGFINNIDPKLISHIDNLCITKKHINSSKRSMDVVLFQKKI